MAKVGSADKTGDRSASLTCAVCLEVFTNPKILPCFHTFCERCLTGLQNTNILLHDRFPCPSCRKWTEVPRGGVSAFQTNFYIDAEELEAARNGFLCARHPRLELELFCDDCDTAICPKCKIVGHETHSTRNLKDVAVPVKREKQAADEKRKAVKQEILRRKAVLNAAVNKITDDALVSLDKIADAVTGQMTTQWVKTVHRPVLRSSRAMPSDALQHMRDYIGNAAMMQMAVSAPEVSVMEQFSCLKDPGTNVCHVCPMDGRIFVSFRSHLSGGAATLEEYTADGKFVVITTRLDVPGRTKTVKDVGSIYLCLQSKPDIMNTYRKIVRDNCIKPLRKDKKAITNIKGDVDARKRHYVVLEEGKTENSQRRVELYQRPEPVAVATYSPPVTPFQPSDVCFYTLGGQEVLLVADELNDAIHVVKVHDGRLSFLRYLAPGCPLLVQPTALNTDRKGRLWVGCRGGKILTCTPITK